MKHTELVKENFVLISRRERKLWKSRGFRRKFGWHIFGKKPGDIAMLGNPQTLTDFGTEKLIGCEILDYCPIIGTYGMGGAGFVGVKFQADGADRWLVFCVWCAGTHLLFEGRVLEAHAHYEGRYQPWIRSGSRWQETVGALTAHLQGLHITAVTLTADACAITLTDETGGTHLLETYAESEKFPPQAGTGKRRNVCEKEPMESLWLVIYDGSDLRV